MNPNAAAFSMILKQREAQSNLGFSYPTQQGWRPPQPPQPYCTPQPPVPQASYYMNPPPQPYFQNSIQYAPPPPSQPFANPSLNFMAPTQPMVYLASPQYPSFYANVQHNVNQNVNSTLNRKSSAPSWSRKNAQLPRSSSQKRPDPVQESGQYYCEPCDKEFALLSAFDTHKATHETCKHPGCQFNATKKVVMAHFHGSHGQFSGTGYQTIDVEGQKFRVLMGQSPEEIAQWRADRRKKFPTAATEEAKRRQLEALEAAGGVAPSKTAAGGVKDRDRGSGREKTDRKRSLPLSGEPSSSEMGGEGSKRSRVEGTGEDAVVDQAEEGEEVVTGTGASSGGKRRCIHYGRGRCNAGDACPFSHAFEPRQCDFFLRGRCRNGFKCFNVHDATKREEYRAAHPLDAQAGTSVREGGEKPKAAGASSGSNAEAREAKMNKRNANGELAIPAPLAGGARGTLLRKLLEDEIAREENVVLQCLRYLVQNNFLQDPSPVTENA